MAVAAAALFSNDEIYCRLANGA